MKCAKHPFIDLVPNEANPAVLYCPVCFESYEKKKHTWPQKPSPTEQEPVPNPMIEGDGEPDYKKGWEASVKASKLQAKRIEELSSLLNDIKYCLDNGLDIQVNSAIHKCISKYPSQPIVKGEQPKALPDITEGEIDEAAKEYEELIEDYDGERDFKAGVKWLQSHQTTPPHD